jgi:hypothetical protein
VNSFPSGTIGGTGEHARLLSVDFEVDGATEREVLQKLGRPKRVEKCGEFFGPLPKDELEKCSKEYFYASPFAPLLPEYFVFRFDATNRVSSKSPYSSP